MKATTLMKTATGSKKIRQGIDKAHIICLALTITLAAAPTFSPDGKNYPLPWCIFAPFSTLCQQQ